MRENLISNQSYKGNWQRILIATGFNLLFEYSMRGINDLFARPFLPFFLFMVYFPYFTILEHCIEKYKMGDVQLLISGFIFGALAAFFIPGGMFAPPLVFGLNWSLFFLITLVWWGTLQAVVTFYLARRIVPTRNYTPFLHGKMFWVFFSILLVFLCIFRIAIKNAPPVSPAGALIILVLVLVMFVILVKGTPGKTAKFECSLLMDIMSALTVIMFLISTFAFTDKESLGIHMVNTTAVKFVSIWTLILFFAVWGYRLFSKKPISV
ncbi:MAG: hypothetical protein ACPL1Y_04090 [Thermoplasmata archaeon]